MSDRDSVTKEYMQDSAVFADAFNFLIYGGEQVIKPEQLRPLDTASVALPYIGGGRPEPVQRYRDVLKSVTAMEDGRAAYLLLGIENQSQLHYAMPVRNMLYDAMQYVTQAEETARSHRTEDKMPETRAEFLSGFYKTDRLIPVITLTLYFGADRWTAPRDLHGMLTADEKILEFVDNYHLHLIAPADIADEDFARFHTELSLALKYVKYSKDKNRLVQIVSEDDAYRSVSRRTADMVNIVTNSNLRYPEGKGDVDMCEAIEGIRNDGRLEGITEGIQKGIEKGMLRTLFELVRKKLLTVDQAAEEAKMTVREFEKKTEELK